MRNTRPRTTAAVFVATVLMTDLALLHPQIVQALHRTPAALTSREWWRFITPVLINPDGWQQVGVNLLGLAVIGAIVEWQWGGRLWLLFYVVGGVVGEAAGLAWQPVGAGSSVAICGLLGAVGAWLLVWTGTGPARFGATWIFGGALVLVGMRDLHGPPILAGGCAAMIVWFVRQHRRPLPPAP